MSPVFREIDRSRPDPEVRFDEGTHVQASCVPDHACDAFANELGLARPLMVCLSFELPGKLFREFD
jgi:hypothetical protein